MDKPNPERPMLTDTIFVTVEVRLYEDGTGKVLVDGQDRTDHLFPDGFPDGEGPEPHG